MQEILPREMESGKKLIVAADDFGLTVRVNEAIAIACREGIVTTASLMATAAAFESAVEIAHGEPKLDVGLHLNLTEGRPVADPDQIPSLAGPSGFLYKHPFKLAAAFVRGKISVSDLEREIRAQIEKAQESKLWITHIDGHKHVQAMPAVHRLICKIAPEYGIHAVRLPRERMPRLTSMLGRNKLSRRKIAKQFVFGKFLSIVSTTARPRTAQPEIITPSRFYGITQTGFLDFAAIADIVHDLDEGVHELMCHPGFVDSDLKRIPTRLIVERERELKLLTSPEVRSLIDEAKVGLISYRDLAETYGTTSRRNQILHRHSAF
jgi:hopanoid biosynthesis associated protein HpnK